MRAALELMKEIRQNESLLGATHVDRLRGRMTTTASSDAGDGAPGDVLDLTVYREMFSQEA
ncbi:hypothetical protein [Microtetraspora malaysiensis]|uniref:phage terminase small subunit n=1 Tax=Microtetraspora malaysiensis TaxID=161358 RepID=UPI003D8E5F81